MVATALRWHEAAPVGIGARVSQLALLGLTLFACFGVGFGIVLSDGTVRIRVSESELVVDVDPGLFAEQRRVALDEIRGLELVSAPLGGRNWGTAKPGHCSGWFQRKGVGEVWEASACTLETVLVRLPDETWSLGPADRAGLLEALRTRTPGDFATPPAPPGPLWWRGLGVVMVALLLVPLAILAALLVPLRYAAAPGTLYVRSPFGMRRFPLADAEARCLEHAKLGLRIFGMGMAGAWFGRFRVDGQSTHVWATRRQGPAILVEGEKRVLLTPAASEPLLADLLAAGARAPG